MRSDKASVIIPTFNKKERLQIVLRSFNYQDTPKENFEVILVDDGSTEATQEVIDSTPMHYPFRHIYQKNRGRSAARNSGIALAEHPLLIFCDDDTIPSKSFIAAHIAAHHDKDHHVVHGMIYNLPYLKFFKDPVKGVLYEQVKEPQTDPVFLKKMLLSQEQSELYKNIEAQRKLTQFEKNIKTIYEENIAELKFLGFTGGNVSVSRQSIKEAGLFDEDFGLVWGSEDLEMGYRLFLSGVSFRYNENACNYHMAHHRCDFKSDLSISMNAFYKKHSHAVIYHLGKLLSGEIKNVNEYLALVHAHEKIELN